MCERERQTDRDRERQRELLRERQRENSELYYTRKELLRGGRGKELLRERERGGRETVRDRGIHS